MGCQSSKMVAKEQPHAQNTKTPAAGTLLGSEAHCEAKQDVQHAAKQEDKHDANQWKRTADAEVAEAESKVEGDKQSMRKFLNSASGEQSTASPSVVSAALPGFSHSHAALPGFSHSHAALPSNSHSHAALKSNSHSHAALRRQSTTSVQREDIDFLVTKFTCHDTTALSSVGKHCKETTWKVQATHDSLPMEVKVQVDKSIMLSPEVSVTCDDKYLYPQKSDSSTKARLMEDFRYQWPFRGSIREGLDEPNRFEIRTRSSSGAEQWFAGMLTKQRADGLFEAVVQVPDNYGVLRPHDYPAVKKEDIRNAMSKQPLQVNEQDLVLEVPREDPLSAALKVEGTKLATHYFGRPTPKRPEEQQAVKFVMSDDRKRMTANVGHSVLSQLLSGDVRRGSSEMRNHSKTWTIQIGPFAQHTIKVDRLPWPSKMVVLTVDDDVLVEASSKDLGCESDIWECTFCFAGEKIIDFDVYESNVEGVKLETRGHAVKRRTYSHSCHIRYVSMKHGCGAELIIDDVQFADLLPKATTYEEETLSFDVEALRDTYGLELPRKINMFAPVGLVGGLRALVAEGGATGTETGAAGLAVVKNAAADAAFAGAAAAASAAASSAAAVSAAAVEAQPHVTQAAERAGHEMGKAAATAGKEFNILFAQCCAAQDVQGEEVMLDAVEPRIDVVSTP